MPRRRAAAPRRLLSAAAPAVLSILPGPAAGARRLRWLRAQEIRVPAPGRSFHSSVVEQILELLQSNGLDPAPAPSLARRRGLVRIDIMDRVDDDVRRLSLFEQRLDCIIDANVSIYSVYNYIVILAGQARQQGAAVGVAGDDVYVLLFDDQFPAALYGFIQLPVVNSARRYGAGIGQRGFADFLLAGRAVHTMVGPGAAVARQFAVALKMAIDRAQAADVAPLRGLGQLPQRRQDLLASGHMQGAA